MPKHHPHQHPHQHPEWFFNVHHIELTPEKIGEYIQSIGDKIKSNGRVRVEGKEVTFPSEDLELIIRHERTPKGEMVFKMEVKWINSQTDGDIPKTGEISID